jgi:protein involved in sex pheromone biosynthesis
MKILSALSVTALVLALAACDSNTADDVTENVNDAMENTAEMAVDAVNEVKDTAEEVGEQVEDGIETISE